LEKKCRSIKNAVREKMNTKGEEKGIKKENKRQR
jgi:hypothetical protein